MRQRTRRFVCAECGWRVDYERGLEARPAPVRCEWEMVELPPAEMVRAASSTQAHLVVKAREVAHD